MFDRVTAGLIASAPALSKVNAERLPSLITDGYVKVAVAKSLLDDTEITRDNLFDELRSIGAAQEAIALNLEPGELRAAASYVAASAYRLLANAFPNAEANEPYLTPEGISPRVAAMLLYLSADAAADAAEVADDVIPESDERFGFLVRLLRSLGRGETRAGSTPLPDFSVDFERSASAIGAAVGYHRCARSLSGLLRVLADPNQSGQWEAEQFRQIASDMADDFPVVIQDEERVTTSLFAGPWHLARLLDLAAPAMIAASSAALPTPSGVDPSRWKRVLSRTAKNRPLLWRNHREALDAGLLEPGVSAVLSFPTGAGKSTVSELKVSATTLRGKNVICLAPTLSLIDQLARAFRLAAPEAKVTAQRDADEDLVPKADGTPEIFVMTPESCLSALGFDPSRFGDVGLVVFDEAHLMHSEGEVPSRRSVDASLCFLTLGARFPAADLMLVSAMFANAPELASWLASITGRRAIALNSPWKPTRQARGALVYRSDEIDRLNARLDDAFRAGNSQGAPVAIKREMTAHAFGFFSLRSTWESSQTRDYRLTPLLDSEVPLGVSGHRQTSGSWWLTPNSNQVAARLASAAARSGVKTLVFAQQIGWTVSISREVASASTRRTALTTAEQRLLERAVEVLGDRSALYLTLEEDAVVGSAIPHHGLLLPEERRLHELLYRRADGVPVLVATSTVTQGMNFPSEFVIIASDRRFDPSANSRVRLEAHELLNAAGRAGRAGAHSNALVLVIPGEIVEYDGRANIGSGWGPLQAAFSKSDQCVALSDPIGTLLDDLDDEGERPLTEYLGRRVDSVSDATVGPEMLRRSFAAYSARRNGSDDWIESRISRLAEVISSESTDTWVRQSALISGLPVPDVAYVADRLEAALSESRDLAGWRSWLLTILRMRPSLVQEVLRIGSRAALSGAPQELDEWALSDLLVDHLQVLLPLWMQGATLSQIQLIGIERGLTRADDRLEFARKFVLRVIPDLAYLFTLPSLIHGQRAASEAIEPLTDDHPLTVLARCIELGVDSEFKVALLDSGGGYTRKTAHDSER